MGVTSFTGFIVALSWLSSTSPEFGSVMSSIAKAATLIQLKAIAQHRTPARIRRNFLNFVILTSIVMFVWLVGRFY